MLQIVFIGMAAGAASALLFASWASGSLLAIVLVNFAALPILIAALGWSHIAGLIAGLVGATALATVFGGSFSIAFLIGVGVPAWWLGYLALLARPTASDLEWYPVGKLVLWASLLAALSVSAVI